MTEQPLRDSIVHLENQLTLFEEVGNKLTKLQQRDGVEVSVDDRPDSEQATIRVMAEEPYDEMIWLEHNANLGGEIKYMHQQDRPYLLNATMRTY